MSKKIRLHIVSPKGDSVIQDSRAREIQESDVDTMRKITRTMLETDGFQIRSINFNTAGEIVVYAYKPGEQPSPADQTKGWVFRRGNLPPTT